MFEQALGKDERVCQGQYVTDAIGEDYKNWSIWNPALIEAPTGSGKNTFVVNTLADYAASMNKCVLLLSNRTAISLQQRKALWKKYYGNYPISSEDLRRMHTIGNILLYSYQEVCSYEQELSNYLIHYVVMDEAHFFFADARFNAETEKIFRWLVSGFRNVIRIYMTATPEQIEGAITSYEAEVHRERGKDAIKAFRAFMTHQDTSNCKLICYRMKPNYDKITFQFFREWETVCDCIAQTFEEEKWIVFVLNEGEKDVIRRLLIQKKVKTKEIAYVDAERKESKSYQDIIRKDKFDAQVLISTIVLDNGINLVDPKLRNVVIQSYDQISMVQMAGRKRRDRLMTKVYIKVPSCDELRNYLKAVTDLRHKAEMYVRGTRNILDDWGELSPQEQKLFSLYKQQGEPAVRGVYCNSFALYKLAFDMGALEDLLSCCEDDPEEGFQKRVLEWFHYTGALKPTLEDDPKYKQKATEQLIKEIKKAIEDRKNLTLEECFAFQDRMGETYKKMVGKEMKKGKDRARICAAISNNMKDIRLPYILKKRRKVEAPQGDRWYFADERER